MREIKFRVWNKNINQLYICDDTYFCKEPLNEAFKLDKFVFMQYTGLKDANGKEIYEGDIVKKLTWPHGPRQVKWHDDVTGFYPFACDPNCDYCMPYGEEFDSKNFEVIGNIYENPELLERIK